LLQVNYLEAVLGDLDGPMASRLQGQIDVLVFNPPYVPTPPDEVGSAGIEAAWAGGVNGRQVIDRFLPRVAKLLSPKGRLYMVSARAWRSKAVFNCAPKCPHFHPRNTLALLRCPQAKHFSAISWISIRLESSVVAGVGGRKLAGRRGAAVG
jgi:methylase of polypeptide subunit release factors